MKLLTKRPRNQVEFKSVKSKEADAVEFEAIILLTEGTDTYKVKEKTIYPVVPHPDFMDALRAFKPHLANYFGADTVRTLVRSKGFKAAAGHTKFADKAYEELLTDYKVTGISWAGADREKIIIKGTFRGCAINTKPMHFSNETYGEEIQELAEKMEEELYEYVFMGKQAQLEIGMGEED